MLELMQRVEALIQAKALEQATGAVRNPGDTSQFGYGHACGIQAGLQIALEILRSAQSSEEEDDEHGSLRRVGSRQLTR